jgi:hypothetical protein
MIRNFAVCFVKKEVEMSWVLRFLHQQKDQLTAKWTTRMDRNRHQANSESKYTLCFNLLHQAFLLAPPHAPKECFPRHFLERREMTSALQDDSRGCITVVATVCADVSSLPPVIIYEGKTILHSA